MEVLPTFPHPVLRSYRYDILQRGESRLDRQEGPSKGKDQEHTPSAAYLMTHMGLGMSERDASECDLSMKLLNHFVPGLVSGKDSRFFDKDIEDMCNGKGRMVGDLSDIDWFEWVKEELYKETRIRYWGGVARNNIQVVESSDSIRFV